MVHEPRYAQAYVMISTVLIILSANEPVFLVAQ